MLDRFFAALAEPWPLYSWPCVSASRTGRSLTTRFRSSWTACWTEQVRLDTADCPEPQDN